MRNFYVYSSLELCIWIRRVLHTSWASNDILTTSKFKDFTFKFRMAGRAEQLPKVEMR
jgi:hypothetical protein